MSYNYKSVINSPKERQQTIHSYCFWENAFTDNEIDQICDMMSKASLDDAYVTRSEQKLDQEQGKLRPVIDNTIRKSRVAFYEPNDSTQWIFDRLNFVIETVNNKWFNFDLNGYERFQYTEYNGQNNEGYGWHTDMFWGELPKDSYTETRKLSLTLLLNTPGVDFEGGELQFGRESDFESARVKKGSIILFPSFALHRVAPVTKGLRKSIVTWVLGPKWK